MLLHKRLSKEDMIGEIVIAKLDDKNPWVEYQKFTERWELTENENGRLHKAAFLGSQIVYLHGESCTIEDYDTRAKTVTLSNDNTIPPIFTISYERYIADFGISVRLLGE